MLSSTMCRYCISTANQVRTEELSQAIKELSEAGEVCVWCVALDEEGMPKRQLRVTTGKGDMYIAGSRLHCARRSHLRQVGVEGATRRP